MKDKLGTRIAEAESRNIFNWYISGLIKQS